MVGRTSWSSRMRTVLRAPFELRTWLATVYLVASLATGVASFVLLVTLIATGVGTAIVWVGVPLLALTMLGWRQAARLERRWVGFALGARIADPYRPVPRRPWRRRWGTMLRDPATWKDLAYLLLLFPLGIVWMVLTTVAWAATLTLLTQPLWYWALPHGELPVVHIGDDRALFWIDSPATSALGVLVGILLLVPSAWLSRGLGAVHATIARGLLGRGRGELEARVDQLSDARSRAVDTAAAERRRIERDLHDGAQQRLVALAMELGMAREKMGTDPHAAQALVAGAHDQAKRAIVELRDLARGIHPAILTEQGLDPALSALAGRSPVPVAARIDVGRLPPALESTAYFIVAEALANVAKHAAATHAEVRVRRADGTVVVEIEDDGVGGAEADGGGLGGLADRAASVEGRLTVTSPPGGPTVVRAELPCAS